MSRKTIWEQFVDNKSTWIGGVLEETEDSFPQVGVASPTEITDITLEPNGDGYFFSVVGKDYTCGFATDTGGVSGRPHQEEGWIYFSGYAGHEFRIKAKEKR